MVTHTFEEFDSLVLSNLHELRQEGSLCDVTLTVGKNEIQAHRCVLAAGSEYFHTLFLGQFKEASMQTIDLSEVANDVKDLQFVIDFMYTGEVDIVDDNFEALVKLSTFLLVSQLSYLCMEFIEKRLNLKTSLRYFLFAASYGLTEIECEAKLNLMSRFHDSYKVILEEDLELSPEDVRLLLTNDIFEHCTASSILYFIFKWLTDTVTDQHANVANQILDFVDEKSVLPADVEHISDQHKTEIQEMFSELKETQKNSKSSAVVELLEKLQKALWKFYPELEIEGDRAGPSSAKKSKGSTQLRAASARRNPCSETEEVVVTLSPSKCVVDTNIDKIDEMIEEFTEPVLTLCCYTPSTKTWYQIREFKMGDDIDSILKELCCNRWIKTTLFKEDIVVVGGRFQKKVYFYNLRTNSWRETPVPDVIDSLQIESLQIDESGGVINVCIVSGSDSLYLVMKVLLYTDKPTGEFFVGLKFDGHTWVTIFKTDMKRDYPCMNCNLQAKVSSVSNELIITNGPQSCSKTGTNYVFIVNLNDEKPVPVNVHTEHILEYGIKNFAFSILETQSHFYVLINNYDENSDGCFVHKYKFRSLTLDQGWTEVYDEKFIIHISDYRGSNSINLSHLIASRGASFWLWEGGSYISFLHETEVTQDRQLTNREHTPPPFSSIKTIDVGELPRDLLDQMTCRPVQEFFHRDKEVEGQNATKSP